MVLSQTLSVTVCSLVSRHFRIQLRHRSVLAIRDSRIDGINKRKPKAISASPYGQSYGFMREEYETIFLGNSRIDVGLNPASDQLPSDFRPAYNLGQPGTG